MVPARRLTWLVLAIAILSAVSATAPFLLNEGPGPTLHRSVRGEDVRLYGYGPYRHMPAEVAVQGLAQEAVTLVAGIPFLLIALAWARGGARAGHLALCGAIAYLFVQYFMYLAMGTYNELFLIWVALVALGFQALTRLLLSAPAAAFVARGGSGRARAFGRTRPLHDHDRTGLRPRSLPPALGARRLRLPQAA
jgi:hypothetical protein